MMKKIVSTLTSLLIFSLSLFVYAGDSSYIQDVAGVLSPEMINKLDDVLLKIDNKEGLHIETVILPEFYGKPPHAIVDAYFQQLTQSDPLKEKRILLLIILSNGFVAVQATPKLAPIYQGNVLNDITTNITKMLQAKDYDEMARIGIAGVYHYYEQKHSQAKRGSAKMIFNILTFALLALVVGVILYRFNNKSA